MIYLWIGLGIFGGVALVLLIIWLNNNLLKTMHYRMELEGLMSGVKIVHLSDLHGKSFAKNNVRLVKRVMEEKPDFIAFTGDIVHRYREKDKRAALGLVSALSGVAPVLFVSGNHEMRNKGYRFFRRDLMEAGATVLDDCTVNICGLTVAGVNCASIKRGQFFKLNEDKSADILLAHMPQYFEKYAQAEYKLVLSGHAHGGQWRIPFTGIGLYAPGQGVFPKYTSGLHESGKTKMIISRGLGNSEFPVRLFNRPEVAVIELMPHI